MCAQGGFRRDDQAGFTLVELLVVMLILGLLSAIAVPAYFAQRNKAMDAEAKMQVRTAATAIESYAADHDGNYAGATVDTLQAIEPTLSDVPDENFEVRSHAHLGLRYRLTVISPTGNEFWVRRNIDGSVRYPCMVAGSGGCPASGEWD